ncbi:zinc-binding metallopeptidase family protein [Alteromonas oceanisediminis]|uniref:zinc-binding metallopeptidase family protein n=1 Tax=Alteromonas oceanisediminis TaxID=2836180 RepID=UPI001BDA2732|nr:putative zinc-binding peptidase [Alteromonas oceanisediminis]MBT0587288.1 putative zinc-binding metallopeptidase [Alteromonas oceanisediminis]
MKIFTCQCGNTLHFPNSECVSCGLMLGFVPDEVRLSAFTKDDEGKFRAAINGKAYRQCQNYSEHDICNWMVPEEDSNVFCQSCRLTEIIPNLSEPENKKLWFRLEQAKRRLLYTCISLGLPIVNRFIAPDTGLGFAFLKNQETDQWGNELFIKQYVSTGHANGLITINLDEADHSMRMETREKMGERYRTLLGHFRHESGHYYWDRLIANRPEIGEFRRLFGDERLDYMSAMQGYYDNGPAENWQNVWISAYASMHPWEDWAETWAHYLHMVDTLETANAFDFSIAGNLIANPATKAKPQNNAYTSVSFTHLFNDWCQLTKVLNGLNRSMGHEDAYPFIISISALDKLRFVHEIVMKNSHEVVA